METNRVHSRVVHSRVVKVDLKPNPNHNHSKDKVHNSRDSLVIRMIKVDLKPNPNHNHSKDKVRNSRIKTHNRTVKAVLNLNHIKGRTDRAVPKDKAKDKMGNKPSNKLLKKETHNLTSIQLDIYLERNMQRKCMLMEGLSLLWVI